MNELDVIKSDLIALCEFGLKKAEGLGVGEVEIFASQAKLIYSKAQNELIKAKQGTLLGIGVRCVSGEKVGFASANSLNKKAITKLIKEASRNAKVRTRDPHFQHLPDPVSRAARDGLIDSDLLAFSHVDAIRSVKELVSEAKAYDSKIGVATSSAKFNCGVFAVTNSRGIEDGAKYAFVRASVSSEAIKGGRSKTGFECLFSRRKVVFDGLGSSAARRAVELLDAISLKGSFQTVTVWENASISGLLRKMLNYALNAFCVQNGKSFFSGKLGQEIASRSLTLLDDGQDPDGLYTSKIDHEGVPRTTTTILEEGLLKTFLYNSYTALKENRVSTGNAYRDFLEPYAFPPSVSATNLIIIPGSNSLSDAISEVDDGVFIRDSAVDIEHANVYTGDFSVVARSAFLIEKGEPTKALESVRVSGNFFKALWHIRETSSDVKVLIEGMIPSVVIENLTISG